MLASFVQETANAPGTAASVSECANRSLAERVPFRCATSPGSPISSSTNY